MVNLIVSLLLLLLELVAKEILFSVGISLKEIQGVGSLRDGGSSRSTRCVLLIPTRISSMLKILILIGSIPGSIRFIKCFKGV